MKDKGIELNNEIAEKCQVVLPCDADKLRDFIINLLETTQRMTWRVQGDFSIDLIDIKNFISIIDQRITTQNGGEAVCLLITVRYSDGSSVSHNSIDRFENFNQVNNCYPTSIDVKVNYLVSFPGKSVPEKQTVGFSFHAMHFHSSYSCFVEYTNLTWGYDLLNLLTVQGKKNVNKGKSVDEKARSSHFYLYMFSNAIGVLMVIYFIFNYINLDSEDILSVNLLKNFFILLGCYHVFKIVVSSLLSLDNYISSSINNIPATLMARL